MDSSLWHIISDWYTLKTVYRSTPKVPICFKYFDNTVYVRYASEFRYKKADEKLNALKHKIEDSEKYV